MNSRLATLAAAACLIASAASAGDLTGTARVIDGDTHRNRRNSRQIVGHRFSLSTIRRVRTRTVKSISVA